MGYYVTLRTANFLVPAAREAEALQALKDLNKRDDLKRGGSYDASGKTESWFSWMPSDYDKTVVSVEDVFKLLGFETDYDPAVGTRLVGYDDKTGQEDLFLAAVAPFVEDGSHLDWVGEDGEHFRHLVSDGKLHTLEARITFE